MSNTSVEDGRLDVPDVQMADSDSDFQTLHEIIEAASGKLDELAWDYVIGGSETETTIKRNRHALDSIALRQRVLVDVSRIDTSAMFFGRKTSMPVHLCPVGSLETIRPGTGAEETARAASASGIPIFVSSSNKAAMEMAKATPGSKIFQLYMRGDRAWIDDFVVRAKQDGYEQLCVTVDSAIGSRRERDIAKRFIKSWKGSTAALEHGAAFNWSDVLRLKETHGMPMILKGIGTAEDAELACQMGIDVVYVSNHGGRALDHGCGTAELLPEIVEAVAGRAKVFVDGGFSRGTDIVKGIALGAHSVGIGRLYLYGLAADGSRGVQRVLEILQREIEITLGLLGLTSFDGLKASHVRRAASVTVPHVHSAFPLLSLSRP